MDSPVTGGEFFSPGENDSSVSLDERRIYLSRRVAQTKNGSWIMQKRRLAAQDCPFFFFSPPKNKTWSGCQVNSFIINE